MVELGLGASHPGRPRREECDAHRPGTSWRGAPAAPPARAAWGVATAVAMAMAMAPARRGPCRGRLGGGGAAPGSASTRGR